MARERRGAALTAAALALMLPALAAAGEGRWTSQGPNADVVSALAIDPSNPQTVFAATYNFPDGEMSPPAGELFKSADGGTTWRALVAAPPGTTVSSLALDAKRQVLYGLLSSGDLFESTDGGHSWRLRHAFGPGPTSIVLDSRDSRVVYLFGSICNFVPTGDDCSAGPMARLWRQRPGEDWETLSIDGARYLLALAIDPASPGRLYAGTDLGVSKSTDDGGHWEVIGRETEGGCRSVPTVAVGANGTLLVGRFDLFDGRNGCGGVYRSTDGGVTWLPVTSLPLHASSFAFDPADPRHVWAGTGDVFFVPPAVYRSSDAGESWLPANEGLEGHLTLQLIIDATGQRLYAASTGVFDIEVGDFERFVVPPQGPPPHPRTVGNRP